MSRSLWRCLLLTLLSLSALTGCGATAQEHLAAWHVPAPYLPPPDPAGYARGATVDGVDAPLPARTTAPRPRPAPPRNEPAAGAPSDAEVRADLQQAYGGRAGLELNRAAIDSRGLAIIPDTAPPKLVALMHAANDVARKPYVYGGGHGRNANEIWQDSAYDCSGSVSYALAAAGYLDGPMVSGDLARWGKPGPGRWVTIYANGGHAFMVVAGLRFDTSGRQRTGTRWQSADARSYAGFSVRHPVGL